MRFMRGRSRSWSPRDLQVGRILDPPYLIACVLGTEGGHYFGQCAKMGLLFSSMQQDPGRQLGKWVDMVMYHCRHCQRISHWSLIFGWFIFTSFQQPLYADLFLFAPCPTCTKTKDRSVFVFLRAPRAKAAHCFCTQESSHLSGFPNMVIDVQIPSFKLALKKRVVVERWTLISDLQYLIFDLFSQVPTSCGTLPVNGSPFSSRRTRNPSRRSTPNGPSSSRGTVGNIVR